jgi:hypothetical protein
MGITEDGDFDLTRILIDNFTNYATICLLIKGWGIYSDIKAITVERMETDPLCLRHLPQITCESFILLVSTVLKVYKNSGS